MQFALVDEPCERRSVAVTSNLAFSKWDEICQEPMTTATAIARVVHHSVILELNVKSYRAQARANESGADPGTGRWRVPKGGRTLESPVNQRVDGGAPPARDTIGPVGCW